jgi:hypothetical protein
MPLTRSQLSTLKRLLRSAYAAVLDAEAIHRAGGDGLAATRLKELARGILAEIDYVDGLIARLP